MTDIFQISKLLIKRKLKVLTDSEKAILKDFAKKNSFVKEIKIKNLADKIDSYSEIDTERAWEILEAKYQEKNKKPVFILNKKSLFKYAAAAVVISSLAITLFYKDKIFNKSTETPEVIVKNDIENIKPGTDKATLTLGDGSNIALEKGTPIQTQNAHSNGGEIIYKDSKQKTSKLVYNYLTIPRGGQFVIKLSDGTKVWLNSASQLKFPVAFIDGASRDVELVYGEAYFEVSHSTEHKGAHFQVYNKNQKVEVVGTEFNIKAYNDESNVYTTLVNGKVNVETGNKKLSLSPNQQLNLDLKSNTSIIKTVNAYNEISWKDGIFSFKGKPLKEIMKVISRWYDVDVVFVDKNLENVQFKGSLDKKQSLEEILSIMKSTTIDSYEIKDKTLMIK
ncbi:FecR family protein [Flavobacterium sp. N2038]|uniref:FecR family protein n=1 Tax=Flavobacterium sp. N2038 TaxID=2986829 RepID=UPI0022252E46|nr:FecR family protein [Flavobacterium sp. N2038]